MIRRQRHLVDWFATDGRDLPWRRTRDPWAVLVSEVMLTQTQVARVLGPYDAFLGRFPTASSCAEAPVGEVIAAWAGLGYNRRAVNLHRSATLVVEGGGEVPDALDGLLELPGVGPYVARAVLAFAFEHDVGVVDTNVARILARWENRPLGRAETQMLADRAVPVGQGWRWNQAMLDLGALVCTKRDPTCARCPVVDRCGWRGVGDDPAAGLGSRQSRFEGSDRQGRGRLVDALRVGPVAVVDLARTMGWPEDPTRADRVAATLLDDGLAVRDDDVFMLP